MDRYMVEMFGACPKCHTKYLIVYNDGYCTCTYCGYDKRVNKS